PSCERTVLRPRHCLHTDGRCVRTSGCSGTLNAQAKPSYGQCSGITPESCHGDPASPERLEGSPHLLAEDFRLLPGREVSALVNLVEVDDVRVTRLDPAA